MMRIEERFAANLQSKQSLENDSNEESGSLIYQTESVEKFGNPNGVANFLDNILPLTSESTVTDESQVKTSAF